MVSSFLPLPYLVARRHTAALAFASVWREAKARQQQTTQKSTQLARMARI
jgi:hypothetical protein